MNIKPCPFCGRTPKVETIKTGNKREWYITCKCGIEQTLYVSKQGAIKAWNRRTQDTDIFAFRKTLTVYEGAEDDEGTAIDKGLEHETR